MVAAVHAAAQRMLGPALRISLAGFALSSFTQFFFFLPALELFIFLGFLGDFFLSFFKTIVWFSGHSKFLSGQSLTRGGWKRGLLKIVAEKKAPRKA